MKTRLAAVALAAALASAAPALATPEEDRRTVSALDVEYQAAVKRNDAATMGRILDDNFVLILGNGTIITRQQLLDGARSGRIVYEQQDEVPGSQTVRVWGDTAVVTAQLWLRGTNEGAAFDRHLWFSDTYVRTPGGWRYALGQASLPPPAPAPAN
jgi:ketosteroid isomerase-like protein